MYIMINIENLNDYKIMDKKIVIYSENGKQYKVKVVTIETIGDPCPEYGSYCSGEYSIWFEKGKKRYEISIENLLFNELIETCIPENKNDIIKFPKWLQDFFCGDGWGDNDEIDGTIFNEENFTSFFELLDNSKVNSDPELAEAITKIKKFINENSKKGRIIRIARN